MLKSLRSRYGGPMIRFLLPLTLCSMVLLAQDEPAPAPPENPAQAETPAPAATPGPGRGGANNGEPRPYDRVITKEAKTQQGVFKVHQVGARYYFEIPPAELGRDFLWVSDIARNTIGAGNGGQQTATRVVRWERHENRVLLRDINFEITADPDQPISRA